MCSSTIVNRPAPGINLAWNANVLVWLWDSTLVLEMARLFLCGSPVSGRMLSCGPGVSIPEGKSTPGPVRWIACWFCSYEGSVNPFCITQSAIILFLPSSFSHGIHCWQWTHENTGSKELIKSALEYAMSPEAPRILRWVFRVPFL